MMPAYGVIFSLILLLFLATVITNNTEASLVQVSLFLYHSPKNPTFYFTDPFTFLAKMVIFPLWAFFGLSVIVVLILR